MNNQSLEFRDFVSDLYDAESFQEAFSILENDVSNYGFDGVLYSYIPQVIIDTGFHVKPVYHASNGFSQEYMKHYYEARYDRVDPLIQAVRDGVKNPIVWWGDICRQYMDASPQSAEVINTTKLYNINSGVTLPLLSGPKGIAGASIISCETETFDKLLDSHLEDLEIRIRTFHNHVISNAQYLSEFIKPFLNTFNQTEKQLLIGLVNGKLPAQLASELNKSEGYLEQVMIRLRRKISGVDDENSYAINKNQLLYYAGMINILECSDE